MTGMKRFGLFHLGTMRYALDVEAIDRILQDARTYPWPRLPDRISAILVADDQLIPLFDLQALFQQDEGESPQPGYQVLVQEASGTFALPADLHARIVPVDKGTLVAAGQADEAWCSGYFDYRQTRYSILDIHSIAIDMTQRIWRNQPDSGARRTQ